MSPKTGARGFRGSLLSDDCGREDGLLAGSFGFRWWMGELKCHISHIVRHGPFGMPADNDELATLVVITRRSRVR